MPVWVAGIILGESELLFWFLFQKLYFHYFSWYAVILSAFFSMIILWILLKKGANRERASVTKLTLIAGLSYIATAWTAITIFPPTMVRDPWDQILPYINSFIAGLVIFALVFLFGTLNTAKSK